MAPPTPLFPVSELEQKIQVTTVNFKEKRRKIRDFDLETCELFELVQYSCTTMQQTMQAALSDRGPAQMECVPFVRLFRRCGKGEKMFHVETTAWEGEHAYELPSEKKREEPVKQAAQQAVQEQPQLPLKNENTFASYGSYFWSK